MYYTTSCIPYFIYHCNQCNRNQHIPFLPHRSFLLWRLPDVVYTCWLCLDIHQLIGFHLDDWILPCASGRYLCLDWPLIYWLTLPDRGYGWEALWGLSKPSLHFVLIKHKCLSHQCCTWMPDIEIFYELSLVTDFDFLWKYKEKKIKELAICDVIWNKLW